MAPVSTVPVVPKCPPTHTFSPAFVVVRGSCSVLNIFKIFIDFLCFSFTELPAPFLSPFAGGKVGVFCLVLAENNCL